MHNGRKLISDTFSDVYTLLEPWVDDCFWDFENFHPESGSICIVGRQQVMQHLDKFKRLCEADCIMVFANSAEGSTTQIGQLQRLGLEDLATNGKMLLLTGGRMPDHYHHLLHEHFLVRIMAYQENIDCMTVIDEIFDRATKPWNFLFLNGRSRPHRKYLWHRFRELGLLDNCLWTMMEGRGSGARDFELRRHGQDLMSQPTPIRSLPAAYEVARYRRESCDVVDHNQFIKFDLFRNEWGEIYLEAAPYVDSYFSVVTETVFDSHHSFFTEKIAKPLLIGHPWIAATGPGFYQDLRDLGFRTFHGIIDESFDTIEHHQSRMERIVTVVQDLCRQDLVSFLAACRDICKYNQQHLIEVVAKENADFATRFFQFIDQHG